MRKGSGGEKYARKLQKKSFFKKGVAKPESPMVYSNSGREISGWRGKKDKLVANESSKQT
ncbi:hypothetical protein [Paenibacillus sp. NEAU-GSW1]|uniref:hypothetical protein n=1 Tax=Paenibacillus sp. NEAU-GSW1 TaxID=2682486 RepID=UPI0012E1074A|nr:hypothetical protein [Paenibacillus sp. NEAU-GSW1]MUT68777.1 hypothetical protein [Paenibacillus sp. NEAU-GSW1]